MCSHDDFDIWLSHDHSIKIRVCKRCHEPEWLNPHYAEEPEWESMLYQNVKSGADLSAPPADEQIPF